MTPECSMRAATAVAAAWMMGVSIACSPPPHPPPDTGASKQDGQHAVLADELARLRVRSGASIGLQKVGRNLFEFVTPRRPSSRPDDARVRSAVVDAAPQPASRPHGLKLVGLAEDNGSSGLDRTAIVSSGRELFFVKEGEGVGERYRVVRISGDSVELTDAEGAASIRLSLR